MLFVTVLTAAAAQVSIPLPFTPVPFTLQPMVVLARRRGARLPARHGEPGAVSRWPASPACRSSPPRRCCRRASRRLLGPTGGYLMSYPFAAFVAGWLAERGFDRRYLTSVARDGLRPRQ